MTVRDNPFDRARQEITSVLRAEGPAHRELRDRLTVVVVITVLIDIVCGVLSFAFERGVQGTQIHGFGDAMFFSTTQLLSVSSSVTNPLSTSGRVLDVIMEVYAITVVTSLAGMTANFFHRRSREKEAA